MIRLGLRQNAAQFSLLVLVNAFVGAMVGMERSILPPMAEAEFGLRARAAVLSFIVVFGVSKAGTNYLAGRLSDRFSRKGVLVAGWLAAVPVPFMLMWAPSWSWVLAANALLGVSQGLTWSTTVIMKIDLAGSARRGLAMGLNEFAGYVAVAGAALATGFIAARYGFRPQGSARRRLARRRARAVHADVGAELELGAGGQRDARTQPGPQLVDDGDHEDRSRRLRAARPGDGAE